MAERLVRVVLSLATLFVLGLPVALAADPVEDVQGTVDDVVGPVRPEQSVNPQQQIDEIKTTIGDATDGGNDGSGNNVPNPLGGEGAYEGPLDILEVLAENKAATAGVAIGVAGMSFAAYYWLASRYIDPKVALQSPERSMLYGFIKGNPGVHLKQLSTEFRMKTSTVLWHVRKLEHADLVRSKKANGYRVFYPVSGGMEASKVSEAVTALSNVNARQVFAFLAENPEAHLRDLSDRLAINAGTVRWHLKKLRKAGLLEEIGSMVRVTELGVKAWNQLQGNPAVQQMPIIELTPEPIEATPEELPARSH